MVFVCMLHAQATISQQTYKKLQRAQEQIEKKEYKQAKITLDKIVISRANGMGKSYALQSLANIAIDKDDYKKVIGYYEQIIKLKAFEADILEKTKFSLAQIYLSEEVYDKALLYSKELLGSKIVPLKDVYENLALIYYYTQKHKASIPYIRKVIDLSKEQEQWYRMLYSVHIELKDYPSAIVTLKYMVKHYSSKEEYWMQLISLYQTTKQYKKSLATLELAYKENAINKEKNIRYLVSILIQNNLHNKAGLMLDKAIQKNWAKNNKKNFDIMISCYLNDKNYDKAIPKLNNSKFSNTDRYQLILGNIYFNHSDYKSVLKVLSKFKFKKNTKTDGQRYILLALSAYELDDRKTTKKYLKQASLNKYEKKRALIIAKDLGHQI